MMFSTPPFLPATRLFSTREAETKVRELPWTPQIGSTFRDSLGSAAGGLDAFIAKFDPSQSGNSSLLYASYLGGSADDIGNGIAVDGVGNAYVVGETLSTNLI